MEGNLHNLEEKGEKRGKKDARGSVPSMPGDKVLLILNPKCNSVQGEERGRPLNSEGVRQ